MSLLTQAKKVQTRIGRPASYSAEDLELVVAYFNGEVTLSQMTSVKKFSSNTQVYAYATCCLKYFAEAGAISITNGRK